MQLVASELVSNVIQHTGEGGTLVAWDPKPDVPFRLEVADHDSTHVAPQDAASHLGGRGLSIVGDVSDAWGIDVHPSGKTVWAEFHRRPPTWREDNCAAIIGRMNPPLVVVTAAADGVAAGCLVQFHCQSGADPFRYAVWLARDSATFEIATRTEHLAVHFLGADDTDVAQRFGEHSGREVDKFATDDWSNGVGGVPLLDRCLTRLVLKTVSLLDDGGAFVGIVGEPYDVSVAAESTAPLRRRDHFSADFARPES